MPGQAYLLTLMVDEAFLTDENTVYPVIIDPTMEVRASNSSSNIIDAPIFNGYPNTNYGNFIFNRVGKVSAYGVGRTVVKLPALTGSDIYTSLDDTNITSVKFYVKEASGTAAISVSVYPLVGNSVWTESNVTWNNAGSADGAAIDTQSLSYANWKSFDITSLVKKWKTGDYDANCGFIMIGSSTTNKSFFASEHSTTDSRPYVVMTYTGDVTLNKTVADVDEGKTLTLTATTTPVGEVVTWSSSNTSVATVNSSGTVTGVALGSTTITAKQADGTSASCLIYVTVADGVYYIKSSVGLYLASNGSIAENAPVSLQAQATSDTLKPPQLWKIMYLGDGYYVIRPMHKLDMALHSTSNDVDIVTADGADTLDGVPLAKRWSITPGSDGYYNLNYVGTSSLSLTYSSGAIYSGMSAITAINSGTSSGFNWDLDIVENPPSGVILYSTQSYNRYSTSPTISIVMNSPQSLSDHNLIAVAYSGSTNYTIKWSSSKPEVVSVDESTGVFSGKSSGTATITGEISLGNSTQKAVFYVRIREAYSLGGEFHEGADVVAAADSWSECGYVSLANTAPIITTLNEGVLNSDIVYFSTHGDQHKIQFENDMTLTDATIAASSTSRSIEDISLSNSVLYIYDACLTASNLDGTGKNLCTSTIDAGADCVIGWTESIYSNDALDWQARFQARLCEGFTIIDAANFANSFIYTDNETIKSWRIYGNPDLFITDTATTAAASDEHYIDISSSADANTAYSETAAIQLIQKSFGEFTLASTDTLAVTQTYTTDSTCNYVVDFVVYRGQYALDVGYTVIVENQKIVSIRNNMNSYVASSLSVLAANAVDFEIIRGQAYTAALNHMYSLSHDYSVIDQSDELYYDFATATRYCRVFTEYRTLAGARGAFVTLYPIDNGGGMYEA